eukprot:CAMPEP_0119062588 /NCGR_PEP_ID=MMETSP1178-20130426/6141_1 /TAXON_ID=33656 /ORGANISM="unid sp, Strain CCMP2000" /LENGTH=51 /DNA_ID=CAMNT_0007043887 /DNA_START=114 /DNA_END=269 /DNA_ORIENTATION=+
MVAEYERNGHTKILAQLHALAQAALEAVAEHDWAGHNALAQLVLAQPRGVL